MYQNIAFTLSKCNIKVSFWFYCLHILVILHLSASNKDLGNLNCNDTISENCEMNEICKAHCNKPCHRSNKKIWGTEIYGYNSSLCRSAVHDLRISIWDETQRDVAFERIPYNEGYLASVRFGFQSKEYGQLENETGSFRFLSPRVKENILDVVSFHKRFIVNAGQQHSQECVLVTDDALSRNMAFDTYIRGEIQPDFINDTQVRDRVQKKRIKITWPKTRNFSGGYQCIPNNSMLSIITSLAMRSDADFVSQKATFTVNVNDSVAINMTRTNTRNTPTQWKKDLNSLHSNESNFYEEIQEDSLHIPRVQVGHAGIYSLERKERFAERALIRLIVRVCPEGRYGKDCSMRCTNCLNGGICHDITGDCICPPGFNGAYCDQACLPGYVGKSCNIPCSAEKSKDSCRGVLVCLPDPYGCSCAAGFKNLGCNSPCSPGEYGASCRQMRECHCVDDRPCDRFSGKCHEGCKEGWYGDACIISPGIVRSITLEEFSFRREIEILITWKEPEEKTVQISYYLVQYRQIGWKHICEDPVDTKEKSQRVKRTFARIRDIRPSARYNLSVAAVTFDIGPFTNIVIETNAEAPSGPPRDLMLNKTSNFVTWKAPLCSLSNGLITSYIIRGLNMNSSNSEDQLFVNTTQTEFSIARLLPYTTYRLRINAATEAGERCEAFSELLFTTEPKAPPPPTNLIVYSRNTSTLSLEWNPPNPPNGELEKYDIIYQTEDDEKPSIKSVIPSSATCEDKFRRISHCTLLRNLQPNRMYNISVKATNKQNLEGNESIQITATTEESVPEKPYFADVIRRTETSLTILWEKPYISNGNIMSYRMNFSRNNADSDDFSKIFDRRTNRYTFNDLSPSTEYHISIEASTVVGFGPPFNLEGKTKIRIPAIKKPELYSNLQNRISIRYFSTENFGDSTSEYFVIVERLHMRDKRYPYEMFKRDDCSSSKVESMYVAAKLYSMPENGIIFVFGDDRCYGGFNNTRLVEGQLYKFGAAVLIHLGNDEKYSDVVFMDEELFLNQQVESKKKEENYMEIVAAVFVPLAIFFIIIVIFLYCKRPKAWENFKRNMTICQKIFPPKEPSQRCFVSSDSVLDQTDTIDTESLSEELTHRIAVKDLESTVRSMLTNGEIRKEYLALPRGHSFPCITARIPENKPKNRYGNMLPYDHSRVILPTLPNDPYSNYINANYIDGYGKRQKYIATQGPKPSTVNDFWTMVWNEGSCKILMAANLFENGKTKCEKYWPDNMQIYTDIAVQFLDLEQYADFNIKTFAISKGKETRELKHFHFITWPDHGVPTYPTPVITFLKKAKAYKPHSDAPIIIHCSAGVGRTGALILLDSMLSMGKAEGYVDPLNQLFMMRQQRSNIVENMDQYVFVYNALVETLCWDNTNVSCVDPLPEITKLRTPDPTTGLLPVEKQFQRLQLQRQDLRYDEVRGAHQPENREKNRSMDILPPERARPILQPIVEGTGSDYINAVYVNGYSKKDAFLVTQFPLPNTIEDFWRMIYNTKSKTIILLQNIDFSNQNSPCYWPEGGNCKCYEEFKIETQTVEVERDILICFLIISSLKTKNEEWNIKLFHFRKWEVGSPLPLYKEGILQLIEKSEKWQHQSGKHVITVQCLNGVSACGIYCASAFLCEKMKTEQEIDVFHTVQSIRTNRPQFIENMMQYNFLYDIAMAYLDSFEIYANFQ